MKNTLENKGQKLKLTTLGFTLIELLAVIVILAIIALIATPIIISIINNTKEESNQRSIEMYANALKNAVAHHQLINNESVVGKYTTSDGKTLSGNVTLTVEYDGRVVCETIEVYEDGNIYLANCKVNGEGIEYTYGINGKRHLAQENVKAVTETTKTTGIVPILDENGNIKPGSEFKIKVSDTIGYLTFFVLSYEGEYVNLIAEQNIASDGRYTIEPQEGDDWYVTSSNSYDNRFGPQKVYTYLSEATNNWVNIPIIEKFYYEDEGHKQNSDIGYQSIKTELDKLTGKYVTTITPYSQDFGSPKTYDNMRARLPYYKEISTKSVGCNKSSSGSCPIWMVNYLYGDTQSEPYYNETNGKVNSVGYNKGYWLLSSLYHSDKAAIHVYHTGIVYSGFYGNELYGARPVITILKSDLLKVM